MRLTCLLALFLACGCVSTPTIELPPPLAVTSVNPAVGSTLNGSGFIVMPGMLATANHQVGKPLLPISVTMHDGTTYKLGKVIATDPIADLAFVNIENCPLAPMLFHLKPVSPGQRVVVLSRAGPTWAAITGPADDVGIDGAIVIDAPGLSPGASGAAVVTEAGELVGMVHGAVDDDPRQVVVVPQKRIAMLMRDFAFGPRESVER